FFFFFSSRRRHTRSKRDWSSDVCSSDLIRITAVFMSILLLPIWMLFSMEPDLLPKELSFIGPKEKGTISIPIQIILADIGVEFLRISAVYTATPLATALSLFAAVLFGYIAINVVLFSREVILY